MNRIYKVIWSKVKHQYVVVSELAHSCTKSAGSRVGRSAAAVLAALVLTTGLCAAPVQAEDLTDPYALLNAQVEETNSTSSDKLVTLVQSPLTKSVAPLANEDEGQPGEGGDTTPTEPTEQHTIYNEEGFYAHNGNSTYNALTKDGLWVGGDDQTVGFHVDNEGNLFTNGTATFKQGADMGGQKITNVAPGNGPTDAVNMSQLTGVEKQILTNTAGDGISVVNDAEGRTSTISVKLKDGEQNLVVDKDGLSLKPEITLDKVTSDNFTVDGTNISLTNAGLVMGDTTKLTSDGLTTGKVTVGNIVLDSTTNKITGLEAGNDPTDAVNKSQLDNVEKQILTNTAGDGISVVNDTEGRTSTISVKLKDGEQNLAVGTEGLSLKPEITLDKITSDNFTVDGTTISLTADGLKIDDKTSLTSAGLTTSKGTFSTSVTVGDTNTIQIGNGKITGLDTDAITDEEDAVNVGFLNKYVNTQKDSAVQYDDSSKTSVTLEGIGGTVINNVKAGDWSAASNAAAPVSQVYSKTGSVTWRSTNFLNDSQDLTTAVSTLDSAIGNNRYTGRGILEVNADHQTYLDVTSAVSTLDQYIGDLTMRSKPGYFSVGDTLTSVTYGLDELSGAIGTLDFKGTSFVKNQGNLTGAVEILDRNLNSALRAVGVLTSEPDENGNVTASTEIDWGGKHTFYYISSGTVVDGMSILDNQIYNINTQLGLSTTGSIDWGNSVSTRLSGSSSIIDGMKNLDTAITGLETRVGVLEQQPGTRSASTTNSAISEGTTAEAATESAPTETTATESPTAPAMESAVAKVPAAANSMLTSAQPMTMALNEPGVSPLSDPAPSDPAPVTPPKPSADHIYTDGDMTTVEKDFTVEGSATFEQGADMNGHKITNVAAGTEATDGVNYGQLQAVENKVDANTQNIGILGSAVNKLGDRIERVGAGAAALAALHPLDFDPDNKLDFAAGFGNYRGASAVAVGAFYRPSENVMFSVGGAFGGGEDMVNAGVSFKVGAGSGSATTSRTAMAKSLKSMQEVVASQDAQLAQQREQIDKLTAMVELLMEQNGQTQPKDDGADTAQPQQ